MTTSFALRTLILTGALFLSGPILILAVRAIAGRRPDAAASTNKVPLWLRYTTLLALSAAILVTAWLGVLPFAAFVCLLTVFGSLELAAAVHTSPVCAVVTVAMVAIAPWQGLPGVLLVAILGLFLLLIGAARPGRRAEILVQAGGAAFTLLIVGVGFSFVVMLRCVPGDVGFGRIIFLYAVMQMNDIFSMLAGLAFGRRKLAPVLSPGKTWVGAIAGLCAAAGGSQLFAYCLPDLPTWQVSILAAVLALVGLAGGLIASAIKRAAGIKDFGKVLPGHGGVVDRFDSLLCAAPFLWLWLSWS